MSSTQQHWYVQMFQTVIMALVHLAVHIGRIISMVGILKKLVVKNLTSPCLYIVISHFMLTGPYMTIRTHLKTYLVADNVIFLNLQKQTKDTSVEMKSLLTQLKIPVIRG